MIRDWVFNTHNNKPEQVQEVLTGNDIDYAVMLDYRDIYYEDDIEPIPLTPEILENSDFHYGKTSNEEDAGSQLNILSDDGWVYDEGGGSVKIIFPNESDGGIIILSDQSFDMDLEFTFVNTIYVHELQHLMRLCKINKEIIL